jgi:hypothetical protein
MKRVLCIMLAGGSLIAPSFLNTAPAHEISIEPCWKDLDQSSNRTEQFGGKWIWSGTFVFKKRSKNPIALYTLDVAWKGENLKHLAGSLFKKEPGKQFYPVENTLVSDGQWKQKDQMLHFHFDHKENLNPVTIFCLVLTIPQNIEQKLRTGKFALQHESLPYEFRNAIQKKKLSFTLNPPKAISGRKLSYIKRRRTRTRLS